MRPEEIAGFMFDMASDWGNRPDFSEFPEAYWDWSSERAEVTVREGSAYGRVLARYRIKIEVEPIQIHGRAPETCGGTGYDPCMASNRTDGRAHDDQIGDEMAAAGLDRTDRRLFRAVLDAGGVTHYLATKDQNEWHDEVDERLDLLMEGDAVFSPATGKWHDVRSAGSHAGTTTVEIDKGDGTSFRFRMASDNTIKTRYGQTHRAVIASGLPVESTVSSRGDQ